MKDRLRFLFSLQQIDTELREIHELKGDLPDIVDRLQNRVDEMKTRMAELSDVMKESKITRERADGEIIELSEKMEKYKGQQLNVKSNRQYDALTREIELAEQKSTQFLKTMEDAENRLTVARNDLEGIKTQLEQVAEELKERQKELKVVNKEHEKSELKLHHERDKIVARLDKDDLDRYERVKKAKDGVAVVPVKRGACGGCFSRVPPQRILEVRQDTRLHVCEHCGRILVSDSVAESGEPAA